MATQIVPSVRMVEHVWMGLTPTLVVVRRGTQDPIANIVLIHVIRSPVSTVRHVRMLTAHTTVTVPLVLRDLDAR